MSQASSSSLPASESHVKKGGDQTLSHSQWPWLHVLRSPPGPLLRTPDERCFTYCSQSPWGRFNQAEPWCRTVCIRKVFTHEVRDILLWYKSPVPPQERLAHDLSLGDPMVHYPDGVEYRPLAVGAFKMTEKQRQIPLPPEGQNPQAFVQQTFIGRMAHHSERSSEDQDAEDDADDYDMGETDEFDDFTESAPVREAPDPSQKPEVRHWQEGWYLWASKSRWAAQERLDQMMMPLDAQIDWERYKRRQNEEWARENGVVLPPQPDLGPEDTNDTYSQAQAGAYGPPYPDLHGQSVLLPLPPPFPSLRTPVENMLRPSGKALEIFYNSLQTGELMQFAGRCYDKMLSKDPFVLALQTCKSIVKHWSGNKDGTDPE